MTALAKKTPEELRDALTGAAIIANHAGNIIRSQAQEIERLRDAINSLLINMKADGGEYRDCYVKAKALVVLDGASNV